MKSFMNPLVEPENDILGLGVSLDLHRSEKGQALFHNQSRFRGSLGFILFVEDGILQGHKSLFDGSDLDLSGSLPVIHSFQHQRGAAN